jgi:NH3-dependent NAD+ synthetase
MGVGPLAEYVLGYETKTAGDMQVENYPLTEA